MTTANQLISDALVLIGVLGGAETVNGNDAVTGLRVLNRMLDAWRQQPNMATHSAWVQFTLPANTTTRTIGPSGQINVARPIKLELGCFTRYQGIDNPLTVVERDQYANVDLKSEAGSWPSSVYYEPASPIGTLYFWPLAGSNVEVFLAVRTQLTKFANLTTDYTLPDGYESAIVASLAERLAPVFERPVPPDVRAEASSARRALKRANAKVPTLDMDGQQLQSRLGAFLGGQ